MNPIETLIVHFGSKNKLAKALGISRPAVAKWKEFIPSGRAYQIEVLTQGKFQAKDLVYRRQSSINIM